MKKRDLAFLLSALVEAGVAHGGSATFVFPGKGEFDVDATKLSSFVDGLNAATDSPKEPQTPRRLDVRAFPTA